MSCSRNNSSCVSRLKLHTSLSPSRKQEKGNWICFERETLLPEHYILNDLCTHMVVYFLHDVGALHQQVLTKGRVA